MHTQSLRFRPSIRLAKATRRSYSLSHQAGRLVQIMLTIYLIPVLLLVLLVGGMGMLVLAIGRIVSSVNPTHRIAG
jgi:hypothetical protein